MKKLVNRESWFVFFTLLDHVHEVALQKAIKVTVFSRKHCSKFNFSQSRPRVKDIQTSDRAGGNLWFRIKKKKKFPCVENTDVTKSSEKKNVSQFKNKI